MCLIYNLSHDQALYETPYHCAHLYFLGASSPLLHEHVMKVFLSNAEAREAPL